MTGAASVAGDVTQHAFLYRNAHMIDLNSLISSSDAAFYTLNSGQGINDKEQIVVNATVNATGQDVALLLTPTAKNFSEEGDNPLLSR